MDGVGKECIHDMATGKADECISEEKISHFQIQKDFWTEEWTQTESRAN